MTDIKTGINLKSIISEISGQQSEPLKRFVLPFDKEELTKLIGTYYRNEVLSRIPRDKYVQMDFDQLRNLSDIVDWLTDPEKRVGLLLYGNVGTGKTTLLKATCKAINRLCKKSQDADTGVVETTFRNVVITIVKAKYITESYATNKGDYDLMVKTDLLAIDEFGVEALDVKLYGNLNEPLIDLLCDRYDHQRCTIISSNLDEAAILQRYGERLYDRFNEMFTMIPFTGKSYRQ